jgi:transcriptional regulator with GAF, ATPase, and Fis domain
VTALQTFLSVAPKSSEESVLRLLVELGAQSVGAEEGSLLVLDPAAKELVFAMTVGSATSEKTLVGQRVPLGEGITGLAAATREVQIGAPVFKGVEQASERADAGPEAVIAAPMLVDDEVVGAITAVSFAKGKRFTGEHASLYARIGAVAGLVVQQLHNIKALEKAAPAGDGSEQEIAESLARLRRIGPGALAHVARLLKEIEAVVASGVG